MPGPRAGTPIGLNQSAVDNDVAVAGRLRRQQRGLQARGTASQHIDAFVEGTRTPHLVGGNRARASRSVS